MKCIHCSSTAKLKFTDKNLCNRCFCKVIEKRVRKYLRLNKLITKGDKVYIDSDVCKYFIDKIISFPIEIVKDKKKADKVVIPWTLDHEGLSFLGKFFEKEFGMEKENKKYVKLFKTIDEKSLFEFCRIKKIKYKKIKDNELSKELDKLSKKYPELKYSLGKSVEILKNL